MPEDLTGFDPARDIRLDAAGLRALAHPLRVRLLGQLRLHGPATASQLAKALDESSGATSYHLRQLALAGFVAEDPERGTKRERWWRSVHRGTRFDMQLDDANREVGGTYLRAVAHADADRLLEFAERIESVDDDYGEGWSDACTISDWALHLTREEARELNREIFELMGRYPRAAHDFAAAHTGTEPVEAKRTLIAQVQLFPLADPDR